jgi:hypothetical protein
MNIATKLEWGEKTIGVSGLVAGHEKQHFDRGIG